MAALNLDAIRRGAYVRTARQGRRRVQFKPRAYARNFDIEPWAGGVAYGREGSATIAVHLDDGRFCTGVRVGDVVEVWLVDGW